MKPGAGKNKGSQFERDIAKIISLWLSKGEKKDLLSRTAVSGGRFTMTAKRGEAVGSPGDLMAVHPLAFKFCDKYIIECKHWRDLDMLTFLYGRGELYAALLKVSREASSLNKSWMLIAKQNNRAACLFVPANDIGISNAIKQAASQGMQVHNILFINAIVTHMLQFDEFLKYIAVESLFSEVK